VTGGVGDGADKALTFLYFLGFLVLVLSALATRRLPWGQTAKMAAAWALIFGAAFVAFSLKDDFLALGRHVVARSSGEGEMVSAGRTLRIRKSDDGHFWVTAKVNGEKVRFLIDSGATVTSLSVEAADRAGIDASGGFPVLVETANGVVKAQRGTVERLEVGAIARRDFPVHVSGAFGGMNVLGMNFLSSLHGWGVEGQWLVLKA
jgi:aspartyl protease family protein